LLRPPFIELARALEGAGVELDSLSVNETSYFSLVWFVVAFWAMC